MSEHHNKFDKDLSEPLNPSQRGKYQLTPKELSEWMLCTNCYPKEKVYHVPTDKLTHEERIARTIEIKEAAAQAPEALLQLHAWGGEQGLFEKLKSNKDIGLDDAQVEASRKYYGDNKPLPRVTKTICDMIMENLGDYFIILLLVAAAVELVLGIWQEGWGHGWVDGASIFMAVVIITTVNVVNSYNTEQTFKKLMEAEEDNHVQITRNGINQQLHCDDIVVGDIINCENSVKLRADGIMVECQDMKTNESDLTGEKDLLQKFPYECNNQDTPEGKPFAFKGTIPTDGTGKMLVTCVGLRTNEGQMEKQMDFTDQETPLQKKLNSIVVWIGKIGIISAALVFLALTLRLVFDIWAFGSRDLADKQNLTDITQAFIVGVTIVVMAIPEGLPLAVTIALQFSLKQLQNVHHALVLKPDATEVMGGCTEICSDKTGTLTQNQMTTMAIWTESQFFDEYDARNANEGPCHANVSKLGSMKDVAEAVLINSSAAYVTDEHGVTKLDGNPTELGVFKYLIACGFDMSNEHKDSLKRSCEFITPFDSKKKFSTVCYKRADGSYRVVVKGAPDFLSLKCTRIERSHGNFEDLSESQVADIMGPDVISKFAAKCYRTILTAYKDFTAEEWALYSESHNVNSKDDNEKISAREGVECNLTISSIFGIEDPLRDNIKDTISKLRKSGVRTRMCTGDNVETARSICEKAGIIVDAKDETDPEIIEKLKDPMFVENRRKYECMTGEDFRKEFGRKNEELDIWEANPRAFHWKTMIIPHLKCLARSSPTDKQILVQGIQNYSDPKAVVAVTGDGTNDCPALKMADVGFAMKTGSDAAKKASKVILTTDDFNSTLICVKFGRNIYDSVQKFLQFQLTVNVVAIFIVLLGAVVLNEKVMTSVQILWVNLIMDTFAALALATEPAVDALLDREPTRREESIVSLTMARNIIGWSIYQIGTLCYVMFAGQALFDLKFRSEDPFYWNCDKVFCPTDASSAFPDATKCADSGIDLVTGVCGVAHAETDKVMMYTMVFNLFVWLQIFNQFNARKIHDKAWNVFSGLTQNCWFLAITFVTVITQIIVVMWLGRPLRTTPLTGMQQLFTIGLGAGIIPWNLIQQAILKKEWFGWASDCVPNEEASEEDVAESGVLAASGKMSVKLSMKQALQKKVQAQVDKDKLSGKFNPSLN